MVFEVLNLNNDIHMHLSQMVIGVDIFNFNLTYEIARTLTGQRVDTINIPCVLIKHEEDGHFDREKIF